MINQNLAANCIAAEEQRKARIRARARTPAPTARHRPTEATTSTRSQLHTDHPSPRSRHTGTQTVWLCWLQATQSQHHKQYFYPQWVKLARGAPHHAIGGCGDTHTILCTVVAKEGLVADLGIDVMQRRTHDLRKRGTLLKGRGLTTITNMCGTD